MQVNLINTAMVNPVNQDLEDKIVPIVPLKAVLVRFDVQATDEWPVSPLYQNEISVSILPHKAKALAFAILKAANELDD